MKEDLRPIVVLSAMDCECTALSAALGAGAPEITGNFEFLEGTLDGRPVVLVKTLFGMVNAACAVTLAIGRYQPRCVIVQGTAGAHDPALHRNDIVLGEKLVQHHFYITRRRAAGAGSCMADWSWPGVQMLRDGKFATVPSLSSDPELLELAAATPYSGGRLVRGTIATGDVWNREVDAIRFFHEKLGTSCEEMEGFAAAQVCAQFGVPVLVLRVISNSELHPDEPFSREAAALGQGYTLDVLRALCAERRRCRAVES